MQKRVVEPQADETRTESKVARAEPSRGAQRAARKVWAIGYIGEPPEPAPADEVEILQAAEIIDRESGRVVLLEALRRLSKATHQMMLNSSGGWTERAEVNSAQLEAEAAIKQAER